MDYLSIIKEPISQELNDFISLFNKALMHEEGLLSSALEHIRNRGGKRMRPMLMLLMAKNFGEVTFVAQHAAVGLELLHTASLVHDDVVDESGERRGQASVNATYNNKVAVLVGDYILSTALLNVAYTQSEDIVRDLAELGRTLSNGEILQLTNISNQEISEEVYYQVINQKTAALFEACAVIGAKAGNASESDVEAARLFGQRIGIILPDTRRHIRLLRFDRDREAYGQRYVGRKADASCYLCVEIDRQQANDGVGNEGERRYGKCR